MDEPLGDLQRLDHAIHASLLLSYFALRAGDLVGLYTYADKPQTWLAPTAGIRNFNRLKLACSGFHTQPVETNHVLGLHNLLSKLQRRTLVVIFSEFIDTTTAELMIETIERLLRKHLVLFVTLDDPLVEQPFDVCPETAEDLAENLVTSDLKQERHKVLRHLQRKGVHIVHGSPEKAATQLVARYTEIKRRELIG